jgi:type IV fimbrial biogenesis protein FimT
MGFTMIELIVTIAIAAVIAALGVPSFNLLIQNSRTSALTNDLSSGLNLARTEAITRADQVDLCPSNDGASCGGNWTDGWIVIVNATNEVLRVYGAPRDAATITQVPAANTTISFGPLGEPAVGPTALTAQVDGCTRDRARRIDVGPVGRVSVTRVPCL